jgi:hypothetical protein
VRVAVSGDLDEHRIAALLAEGAPIDVFGVGTRMSTSADAPFLDCAYKLAEYGGIGRRKRSPGKESWPGHKQVYRSLGADGRIVHDTLGLDGAAVQGRPLLQTVLLGGRRSVAQFTPKSVETASEREKLMFRVRAQVDRKILERYARPRHVKAGVPGVAWVRLDQDRAWPSELALRGVQKGAVKDAQ